MIRPGETLSVLRWTLFCVFVGVAVPGLAGCFFFPNLDPLHARAREGASDAGSSDTAPDEPVVCARPCGNGACVGGACQPFVFTTGNQPTSFVADDVFLYWTTSGGQVRKFQMSGAGALVQDISDGWFRPRGLALGDSGGGSQTLCWVDEGQTDATGAFIAGSGSVSAGPSDGTKFTTMRGQDRPRDCVIAPFLVYWTVHGINGTANPQGDLRTCQLPDCSNGQTIVSVPPPAPINPTELILSANRLYWLSRNAEGDPVDGPLRWLSVATDQPTTGSPLPDVTGVSSAAIVNSTLYYTLWGTGSAAGRVAVLPLGAGSEQGLDGVAHPTAVQADGTEIFWLDTPAGSATSRLVHAASPSALAAGNIQVLSGNANPPLLVTQDAAYFVAGGDIMKMVR